MEPEISAGTRGRITSGPRPIVPSRHQATDVPTPDSYQGPTFPLTMVMKLGEVHDTLCLIHQHMREAEERRRPPLSLVGIALAVWLGIAAAVASILVVLLAVAVLTGAFDHTATPVFPPDTSSSVDRTIVG